MRILFVSNIYPPHVRGGYELGCQTIAHEMQRLGHVVCVATSISPGYLNSSAPDNQVRVETCFEPVFAYEAQLMNSLSASYDWKRYQQTAFGGLMSGNALALARLAREFQPDVIWIFNPLGLGPLGIFEAALTYPAKCVVHLMDDVDGMIRHFSPPSFSHSRLSRLKRRLTAISCSFKTMATNELYGAYRNHRVIYNGVDFAELAGSCDQRKTLNSGKVKFVYFGQVEAAKGLLEMVKGARIAHLNGLEFEIDIIGKGSKVFEEQLRQAVTEAGLAEVVRPLGFLGRNELLKSLPSYDAAILLLGEAEPFGYSAIEAIGSGLPLIVTIGPGSVECFPADYPLFISDRNCAEAVASKIEWICENQTSARHSTDDALKHLKKFCDLRSVVLPSYLRTLRACPINNFPSNVEDFIDSYSTAEFNSWSRQ